MNYFLDLKTDNTKAFISAIEADAKAAGAADAPVSDNGIALRGDPENKPRGEDQLVTLLLTIPVGITVDVAADQIKSYLRRKRGIKEAKITWTEEALDADGNVDAIPREQKVELDES
ncbi:hypothetical protein AB0B95_10540 [Streptomyces hygroscopicus]|uniref:hypothetical protein n=1 Tax=Streptomyces hygroscopicus TaxID=1912 RepID=UPI0007671F54|nr:hypothetical protein [Streptomyces hygroscopicus]